MRILHVIPYMHPNAGGPPVVVEHFVRETLAHGHLSEIISTPLFCHGDEQALLETLNELAPTVFVSGSKALGVWGRSGRRHIEQSVRSTDIVHLHTLWHPINVMVRLACARHRRPYVLMPHGMLDPYSLSVKRWRKAAYLWAIERRNISAANRLIYTTAEEARLAAANLVLPQGVVVPLGGDAPSKNVEELASRFLKMFPRARGRPQLLFLGRLHFKKGLDRILRALPLVVKVFPEVLLTIVGEGSPEFDAMMHNLIADQRLAENVLLTGSLQGELKWGAYATSELFLLPSRQENFAITVAEAMQMGIPVIISNKVNSWPHVQAADAGLILDEHGTEAGLADHILSLLTDCGRRKQMGKRGQDYARKTLTWAGAATSLLKCYDEVLAHTPSRS